MFAVKAMDHSNGGALVAAMDLRGGTELARSTSSAYAAQLHSPQRNTGNSSLWSASSSGDANTSEASSPSSPATSLPAVEPYAGSTCSFHRLPLHFLQSVLATAGSAAGNGMLVSKAMQAAWQGVIADPRLAAQWLRERYGPCRALDALSDVPMERYLRPCLTAGSNQASSVSRVHILGLLVVSGCYPRLSPGPAAVLLRDACAAGSPQAVQLVLRCGSPGAAAAQRALLAAVERNHRDCVRQVLNCAGLSPTADGSLALRLACKSGALGCVEELLGATAVSSPTAAPGQGFMAEQAAPSPRAPQVEAPGGHSIPSLALALAQAASCGHTGVQAALLRASRHPAALATLALIRVSSSGHDGIAALATSPAAVRALFASGADPSAYGNAALIAACQRPAAGGALDAAAGEVVRELVRGGADARADDSSPLVTACRAGASVDVVVALLEAGAEAGAQESAGLRFACKLGSGAVVAALLAAPRGAHGLFGLATAVAEAAVAGHTSLVESCVAACAPHGLDPQAVRDLALIQASQVGCLSAAQYLIASGANAVACGSKALAAAAEGGHASVLAALLVAGADPAARDGTPLVAAARCGRTDCVQLLLAAGADPCARDSWALWVASEAGHMNTVAALMAAGADPTFEDTFDVSALIDEMACD